jgi:hypothetical protein
MSIPTLVDVDLDDNGVVDDDAVEAGAPLRRPVYEDIVNAFVDESCAAASTDPTAADPRPRIWLCYSSSALFPDDHVTNPALE